MGFEALRRGRRQAEYSVGTHPGLGDGYGEAVAAVWGGARRASGSERGLRVRRRRDPRTRPARSARGPRGLPDRRSEGARRREGGAGSRALARRRASGGRRASCGETTRLRSSRWDSARGSRPPKEGSRGARRRRRIGSSSGRAPGRLAPATARTRSPALRQSRAACCRSCRGRRRGRRGRRCRGRSPTARELPRPAGSRGRESRCGSPPRPSPRRGFRGWVSPGSSRRGTG